MKLISSENIVFVPLKVKHLKYLKEHFTIMSSEFPSSEASEFLARLFTKLLNSVDVI